MSTATRPAPHAGVTDLRELLPRQRLAPADDFVLVQPHPRPWASPTTPAAGATSAPALLEPALEAQEAAKQSAADDGDPDSRLDSPAAARAGRFASRLANALLTLLAVLGLLSVGVTVTATATGLRPLVVRSGSMEPHIPTGSMVLIRSAPATSVEPGEVIAVQRPDGVRVTHRVVSATPQGGGSVSFVLKGDANQDEDPAPVSAVKVGEVVLNVPRAGRLGGLLTDSRGAFALGAVVAALFGGVLRGRRKP